MRRSVAATPGEQSVNVLAAILTAAGAFAVTNVDNLILLMALTGSQRLARPSRWQILAGQYLGMVLLVAASGAVAAGLIAIPDRTVSLVGIIPLLLGVRGLVVALRARESKDTSPAMKGTLRVALLTVACGADNLAVYAVLFRGAWPYTGVVYVVVFAMLIPVWWAAASVLVAWAPVRRRIERVGRWVTPAVLIGIGAAILARVS